MHTLHSIAQHHEQMHLLSNEPHNEGVPHCESSLFNNEGICLSLGNNEPRFREIISPREMSTIEKISTVRVSFDPKFTQTVLVHSLLGISQGDIISQNLAGGSLLGSLLEQ